MPPEFIKTGWYDGCQGTVWQLGLILVQMLSRVGAFDYPEQALTIPARIPQYISPGMF